MKISHTNASRLALATTLAFAIGAQPAFAQDAETETEESNDTIVVSAEGLDELDFISGQDVYTIEEIQRDLAGQLGDLLIKVPGVSATRTSGQIASSSSPRSTSNSPSRASRRSSRFSRR